MIVTAGAAVAVAVAVSLPLVVINVTVVVVVSLLLLLLSIRNYYEQSSDRQSIIIVADHRFRYCCDVVVVTKIVIIIVGVGVGVVGVYGSLSSNRRDAVGGTERDWVCIVV